MALLIPGAGFVTTYWSHHNYSNIYGRLPDKFGKKSARVFKDISLPGM